MEDTKIVDLFWERSETAISETEKKYGKYCHAVAYHILSSHHDAEECVNDTYMRAWRTMPPQRPSRLASFLGRITRNLALDRLFCARAQKRGEVLPILEELSETLPDGQKDAVLEEIIMKEALNGFLASLDENTRVIFMRRYWYCLSVKEIAKLSGITENNVSVILHRTRKLFKIYLEKEGISL